MFPARDIFVFLVSCLAGFEMSILERNFSMRWVETYISSVFEPEAKCYVSKVKRVIRHILTLNPIKTVTF